MGFMVGPERRVQSKVPQGLTAAGSPGFFCSLFTGTQWHCLCLSGAGYFLFQDPSEINLVISFLPQKWKLQTTPVVPTTREALCSLRWTSLIPKCPFLLYSFLFHHCIHVLGTSLQVLGSGEGFTNMSQDHWGPCGDRWLDTEKNSQGVKQRGTETKETGADRG